MAKNLLVDLPSIRWLIFLTLKGLICPYMIPNFMVEVVYPTVNIPYKEGTEL